VGPHPFEASITMLLLEVGGRRGHDWRCRPIAAGGASGAARRGLAAHLAHLDEQRHHLNGPHRPPRADHAAWKRHGALLRTSIDRLRVEIVAAAGEPDAGHPARTGPGVDTVRREAGTHPRRGNPTRRRTLSRSPPLAINHRVRAP
jgi:hypothetical protein